MRSLALVVLLAGCGPVDAPADAADVITDTGPTAEEQALLGLWVRSDLAPFGDPPNYTMTLDFRADHTLITEVDAVEIGCGWRGRTRQLSHWRLEGAGLVIDRDGGRCWYIGGRCTGIPQWTCQSLDLVVESLTYENSTLPGSTTQYLRLATPSGDAATELGFYIEFAR
jgi:hypothetical protein